MRPASRRTLVWLHRLIWLLLYGGLLLLIVGYARQRDAGAGDTGLMLMLAGGVALAAGLVLIFVRSRLQEAP